MAKRKTLTPEEAETRAALTAKRCRANTLFRKATKGRPEHDAALDCLADILDLITTLERLADGDDGGDFYKIDGRRVYVRINS